MLLAAALILLLAPGCLCAGKEPQPEERLYKSKEWKDSSRPLILTKQSQSNLAASHNQMALLSLMLLFFLQALFQ